MKISDYYLKPHSRLIRRLFLKKKLLEKRDARHEHIRSLLLIPSGGLRGANAGGSALALSLLGLQDVFDVVVGVSTGAAVASYFLSGGDKPYRGASVYYEECTTEEFSNLACLRPYVDIDYIERVMKKGKKKIDPGHIRAARSKFYVGVMRVPDGRGILLDVKKAKPGILSAVKASMAMYGLYNKPVKVNGKYFLDGEPCFPLPIREVVEKFKPTDILVLSSTTLEKETPTNKMGEEVIAAATLSKHPRIIKAIEGHHARYAESLEFLARKTKTCIGIIPPADQELTMLTQEGMLVKKAVAKAARRTLRLFGKPDINFELL